MDVGVVLEETLHGGVVEVRAMVDAGDLGGRTAEDLGLPGVEVTVEVDDGHRAVLAVDGAQQGEGDGVVTSQGDDSGQGLALLGGAELVGVGGGLPGEDAVVALLDLVQSPSVVEPDDVALFSPGTSISLGGTKAHTK